MAIALEGRVYAQILNDKVHWVFDSTKLPEWNEKQCLAIDITNINPKPEEGWNYDGVNFSKPVPDINAAWDRLRELRDIIISKSDWTQLVDVQNSFSEEQKNAWNSYRQALRDLPSTTEDPFNVTWPKSPLEIE
jgi:hypothetical protein